MLSALPTITNPVDINGTSQPGFAGTPLIVLDGTNAGSTANGLTITAGNSTVRGLVIDHFGQNGIELETGSANDVRGNYIGVDSTGEVGAGNGGSGVDIYNSASNTIGGTGSQARNIISDNRVDGVDVYESNLNAVSGNYIGTDAKGTTALANTYGVDVNGSANDTIGGTAAGDRNILSANKEDGVELIGSGTTGNLV